MAEETKPGVAAPQPDPHRLSELELWERIQKRWDDRVGGQVRVALGILTVVTVIVGFLGIRSLYDVMTRSVESDVKMAAHAVQASIEESTKRLSDQLGEKLASMIVQVAALDRQAARARKLISQMEEYKTRFEEIEMDLKQREVAARKQIEKVQARLSQLDRVTSSLALAAAPSQGEDPAAPPPKDIGPEGVAVLDALGVRQVPTALRKTVGQSSRTNYLLTLSAFVDDSVAPDKARTLLDSVSRVTYTLDSNWF